MDSIKEINSAIRAESESLLRELEAKLKNVSKSQPSFAGDNATVADDSGELADWLTKSPKAYLTWGVVIGVTGLIKMVTVDDDSFSFFGLILIVIAALMIYNYNSKNKEGSASSVKNGKEELSNSDRKQLYIDTAGSAIDDIQRKWKSMMRENKQKVQNLINNAGCSADKKSQAMDCTLMIENWNIDTTLLSDELDALTDDGMFKIKADTAITHFVAYVAKTVRETVRRQMAEYDNVEKIING